MSITKITNRLYILGAGGYGREIAGYLRQETPENIEIVGFLDDNLNALEGINSPFSIVGSITDHKFDEEDLVLPAIADIAIKKKVVNYLEDKVSFYSFVSSKALIGPGVKLGKGIVVCPGVKLGANMELSDYVSVNVNTVIGHDSHIGDYTSIMPSVDIGGGATIGEEVFIATKSVVAPLLSVCKKAYLGIGSVNIKNISEPGIYFGNPARRMK